MLTAWPNAKAKVAYAPFEVANYLDYEEAIAQYFSLAARDENPGVLLKALGDVAKARGMVDNPRKDYPETIVARQDFQDQPCVVFQTLRFGRTEPVRAGERQSPSLD